MIFILIFPFIPDTPHYFVTRGDRHRAIQSLEFLRQKDSDEVGEELDEIETSVAESMSHRARIIDVFRGRANLIGKITFTYIFYTIIITYFFSSSDRCWIDLLPEFLWYRRSFILLRDDFQEGWKLIKFSNSNNSHWISHVSLVMYHTVLCR